MRKTLAIIALLAFGGIGPADAQSPANQASGPGGSAPAAKAKPARTSKSLACSKEADAKNIHGKKRRQFMRSCKRV